MTVRRTPSTLEKTRRLALSALVLLAAAFPGGASAQEFRVERAGVSAPVGGSAAASAGGAAFAGTARLAGGAPGLLAAPVSEAASAPAAFAPGAASAPAMPAALPAAAASPRPIAGGETGAEAAAASVSPAYRAGQTPGRLALPSPGARAGSEARPAAGAVLLAAPALDVPSAEASGARRSAETDRADAERGFSALLGERLAEGRGEASAVAAPDGAVRTERASSLSRLAASRPLRAGAGLVASVPALIAFGAHPNLAVLLHPAVPTWHALSVAGYLAGNVGAAIFPLVQIYETFHGKSTPKSRAFVGAAASLALGLISAPILHKTLWGVQNLFGGITLLIPLFLGALAARVKGRGLKETALLSAAAAAVSAAVYFAAAAAVPALLASFLSAAAIAKLAFAVQCATSAMFLWMFLPDTVKVLRGKAAGGFSPGFNLMFFLSALGSMFWAVPSAWIYSGADQNTYRIIFAVNAIYALVSFISFRFARGESKPGAN